MTRGRKAIAKRIQERKRVSEEEATERAKGKKRTTRGKKAREWAKGRKEGE